MEFPEKIPQQKELTMAGKRRFLFVMKDGNGKEQIFVINARGRRHAIAETRVLHPCLRSFTVTSDRDRINRFIQTGVFQKWQSDLEHYL